MDQASLAEWVGGFFDGEGYVGTDVHKRDRAAIGYQLKPQVAVGHSYVGGLFDAEGTVQVSVAEDESWGAGYHTQPSMKVKMAENDVLVKRLQQFADSIDVESAVYHLGNDNDKWADCFTWQITGMGDVNRFCEEIRPHVVLKRPEVDILLDEIIPLLRMGEQGHRRGYLKLIAWRDVMNSHKGGTRGKYTLEYFEDLWGMSLEPDKLPEAHPRYNNPPEAAP